MASSYTKNPCGPIGHIRRISVRVGPVGSRIGRTKNKQALSDAPLWFPNDSATENLSSVNLTTRRTAAFHGPSATLARPRFAQPAPLRFRPSRTQCWRPVTRESPTCVRQTAGRLSITCQQAVGPMSTNGQSGVNKLPSSCQKVVSNLSTDCQQAVGGGLINCQNLFTRKEVVFERPFATAIVSPQKPAIPTSVARRASGNWYAKCITP